MRVNSQGKCTQRKPLHLRVCTEPTCNTAPQEIWFWGQRGVSWLCRTAPEPLHIYWELMGKQRRMKIVLCHLERETWFSSSHNSSSLSLNPDGWWTLWRTVSISLAVCSSSWTTLRISCNKIAQDQCFMIESHNSKSKDMVLKTYFDKRGSHSSMWKVFK